ncbi:hypothetical protein NIE88_18315 [Sporolactobacillus shoreicorticis]|uniref:Sensor histidine kinase n=1 Tax=Sporolactobacillus shoreicorticis TaxID=1923877 RepID=A0ABW5S8V3_9BACL|nr:ATP-binding protein [Sporolactobacillus shoreicorticis]MCO7127702.1 hypothetical protein [Sporolactobacillus shoreicorticis]
MVVNLKIRKQMMPLASLAVALLAAMTLLTIRNSASNPILDSVLPFFFFLFCFSLGLYLWVMNKRAKGERTLIFCLADISLLWLAWGAGRTEHERFLCLVLYLFVFYSALILLMQVLQNYFSYWGLTWMSGKTKITLIGSTASMFVVFLLASVTNRAGVRSVSMLYVAVVMISAMVMAVRASRRYSDPAYRPMLQTLTLGLILSFLPDLVLSLIPSIIQDTFIFRPLAGIFLFILPAFLFYLVVSERFLDPDFVTISFVYCAMIAAPSSAVLGAAFYALNRWNLIAYDGVTDYRFLVVSFLAIFTILYIKQYLDYSLRKRLYPKQQDAQTSINRFLQWMKKDYGLGDVGRIIKREMEATLPVEDVRMSRTDPKESIAETSDSESESKINQEKEGLGKLFATQNGFRILLYENVRRKIILTGKWSLPRRRLNPDERVWLETLINYIQIVIENLANTKDMLKNLEGSSDLSTSVPLTVKKMMLRISERERWKLSRSLHDQNMQDQLDIARQLDAWGADADNPESKALMVKFREQILDSVYVLRQVINDLHPEFIYRTGLRTALVELFNKVNLSANFTLHWAVDEHLDGFQREWEMAVYRVVQELLNNAQKHSRAHLVMLKLRKENDLFTLNYSDDGIGLDVSKIGNSFGTMGFPGMIGRVEGLGGRITIRSEKGKGLAITMQWTSKEIYTG